jgi:hypothetical protein
VLDNCPITVQGSLTVNGAVPAALPSLTLKRAASVLVNEGVFTVNQAVIVQEAVEVKYLDLADTPLNSISMNNTLFTVSNGAVFGNGIVVTQTSNVYATACV